MQTGSQTQRIPHERFLNPCDLFSSMYAEELQVSKDPVPSGCCLSTIGLDGYPNSRIVSLKEINATSFIITGSLGSAKGREIALCNKISLNFWWPNTRKQVRVQGDATRLPTELAEVYFQERPLDARVISTISRQGEPLGSMEDLQLNFEKYKNNAGAKAIPLPADWGGYIIKPIRVEFMEFKLTRLHERVLYQLQDAHWIKSLLQP